MGIERIPDEVLDRPVKGLNLQGISLGEQWGGGHALLVFLRHLG